MAVLKVAVMASGSGTDFQSLLNRFHGIDGSPVEIVLLVTDRDGAGALERAVNAGIETRVIRPGYFPDSESFGRTMIETFKHCATDLIVLAGYLKLLPANLVSAYSNRIINIHPALLPGFGGQGMYGIRVHRAVLDSGAKLSGPTVHFVNQEYDRGAIIAQRAVPVLHDDTPETLAARVLEEEHRLLPEVVQWIAEGRVQIEDGIAKVRN